MTKTAIDYFKEICMIPHASYQEGLLADMVESFAKQHNLRYVKDEMNNVIVYKPATKGYETVKPVILQAHLDMVAEKTPESQHNFTKDPLTLIEKEGMLWADKTTLGADDGVGVAYMLAILADENLQHPALECVFTVQEEVGLLGMQALDTNLLSGAYCIGLDSSGENVTYVSSSGGVRGDVFIPRHYVGNDDPALIVKVRGLQGGHSGSDIDLQRGNGIKILAQVIYQLQQQFNLGIATVSGGAKENAIARDAQATITYAEDQFMQLQAAIENLKSELQKQYQASDTGIRLEVEPTTATRKLTPKIGADLIKVLLIMPYGTRFKNIALNDLVVNSANIGVIEEVDNNFRIGFSLRAAQDFVLDCTMNEVKVMIEALGYQVSFRARYPGWPYEADSKLRDCLKQVYQTLRGESIVEHATQGGVELGVLKGKMPNLDIIGIGPKMYDIHTPNEHLDIASFTRTYEVLIAVLEAMQTLA